MNLTQLKLEKFLPTLSTVEGLHVDYMLPAAAVFVFVLLFALLLFVLLLWLSHVSLILMPTSVRLAGRG